MTQAPTCSLENSWLSSLTSATSTRKMAQSHCEGEARDYHSHQFSITCSKTGFDFFLSIFPFSESRANIQSLPKHHACLLALSLSLSFSCLGLFLALPRFFSKKIIISWLEKVVILFAFCIWLSKWINVGVKWVEEVIFFFLFFEVIFFVKFS